MDELIARSLKGETSDAEEESLREWRRASLANEKHYRELARIWSDAPLARVGPAPRPRPAVQELLEAATRGTSRRAARVRWLRRGLAMTAMILLGVGVARWGLRGRLGRPFGTTEMVTDMAEMVTVSLRDGSTVRLGEESRLRLSRDEASREVWLNGRAYFAVAKQKGRPFTVHTPVGDAVVLGTRFELRATGGELRLVVVEGRVALDVGGRRVEVGAGEMSQVVDGVPPSVVKVADPWATIGWIEGVLMFQATPLQRAAAEIARRYRLRVDVTDSILAQRTVSGVFTNRTFQQVMTVVCGVIDAQCELSETGAVVRP